jgi:hypothetical protein
MTAGTFWKNRARSAPVQVFGVGISVRLSQLTI